MRLNIYLSDLDGHRIALCPIGARSELQAVDRALRVTYEARAGWGRTALAAVDADTGVPVVHRTENRTRSQ